MPPVKKDDDNRTIVTSNCTHDLTNVFAGKMTIQHTMAATTHHLFGAPMPQYLNALTFAILQAIAHTGATSILVKEETPIRNLCLAINPLSINLPDGNKVKSTPMYDITIPSFPTMLVGHVFLKIVHCFINRRPGFVKFKM
jgi:hypothetical protein